MAKSQVVYEVNTFIDKEAKEEFLSFLNEHIQQLLALPGFLSGDLLEVDPDDSTPENKVPLCCTYLVESRELLQRYFDNEAHAMRADTMRLFEGRVTATRRIHTVKKRYTKTD
jgi:hypothetical protein